MWNLYFQHNKITIEIKKNQHRNNLNAHIFIGIIIIYLADVHSEFIEFISKEFNEFRMHTIF